MQKKPFVVGSFVHFPLKLHPSIFGRMHSFSKGVVLKVEQGRSLVRIAYGQQLWMDNNKILHLRNSKRPTLKQIEQVIDRIIRIRENIFLDWTDSDDDIKPLLHEVASAAKITFLDCGGYRAAFLYRGLVIKVPFDSVGEELNVAEKNLWDNIIKDSEIEPFFIPCLYLYKGYTVYDCAYGFEHHRDYILFKEEIERAYDIVSKKLIPLNSEFSLFLRDLLYTPQAKSHRWRNWGLFNQSPVMLDYAI